MIRLKNLKSYNKQKTKNKENENIRSIGQGEAKRRK
jgi:hypothetical protein